MNQIFVAFNNSAAASALQNIEPSLAHILQTAAQRFSALALGTASYQRLGPAEELQKLSAQTYQIGRDEKSNGTGVPSGVQSLEATDYPVDASENTSDPATAPWGYVVSAEPTHIEHEYVKGVIDNAPTNEIPTAPFATDWHPAGPINQHRMAISEMTIDAQSLVPSFTKSLATPSTYSFKESTFARRLLRASYERANRAFMDPDNNAPFIQSMCKFSFCFTNSAKMANWVKKMASATRNDSLELWQAPALHLGNAGLHYPRTSLDGADPPPSFWAKKAPMGPRPSLTAETPVPDSMATEEVIEMVGFQGEWFDPNDVEHYLKSKGLILDEQSSWAELDVAALPSLEATAVPAVGSPTSSGPGTDPSSPKDTDSLFPNGLVLQGTDYFWGDAAMNMLGDTNNGVDTQVHELPSHAEAPTSSIPLFNDSYSFFDTHTKTMVDVDKFLGSKSSLSSAISGLS